MIRQVRLYQRYPPGGGGGGGGSSISGGGTTAQSDTRANLSSFLYGDTTTTTLTSTPPVGLTADLPNGNLILGNGVTLILVKAIGGGGSTWSISAFITAFGLRWSQTNSDYGLMIINTSNNNRYYFWYRGWNASISVYSETGGTVVSQPMNMSNCYGNPPMQWFQMSADGTNIHFQFGADGLHWTDIISPITLASFIGTSNLYYGFYLGQQAANCDATPYNFVQVSNLTLTP